MLDRELGQIWVYICVSNKFSLKTHKKFLKKRKENVASGTYNFYRLFWTMKAHHGVVHPFETWKYKIRVPKNDIIFA